MNRKWDLGQKNAETVGLTWGILCNEESSDKSVCNQISGSVDVFLVERSAFGVGVL